MSFRLKDEKPSYGKQRLFHSKRSDNTKNSSSSMKVDVLAYKIRSCIVLKDALAKKLCYERTSQSTCLFTFSVVVVDLPVDCILSFLFAAETDVVVPVLSQSTDVVVVNFVVVELNLCPRSSKL